MSDFDHDQYAKATTTAERLAAVRQAISRAMLTNSFSRRNNSWTGPSLADLRQMEKDLEQQLVQEQQQQQQKPGPIVHSFENWGE